MYFFVTVPDNPAAVLVDYRVEYLITLFMFLLICSIVTEATWQITFKVNIIEYPITNFNYQCQMRPIPFISICICGN